MHVILIVLICALATGLPTAWAQKKPVVRIFRLESQQYPIQVVSRDVMMNQWLLEETEDAMEDALRLLELPSVPFSQLIVRWRPGDATGAISFPRAIRIQEQQVKIDVDVTGAQRSQVVAIKRTLVIAILQACIWEGNNEIETDVIPDPPLWLSEGLLWYSLGYAHDEWRQVIEKASRTGRLPALAEVQRWDELSELRLEQRWQQAVAYCLVRKTFQSSAEKRAVMLWLKNQKNPHASLFWENSQSVEDWWQEVASQPLNKKIPLKDWDESVAMLNQLRHLSVRLRNRERKMFFIGELPEGVALDPKDKSLEEYALNFDLLALSSHYALRPAVNRYRQALKLWMEDDYTAYQEAVKEAREWEDWSVQRKQKAKDMLDWAVVNLSVQTDTSSNELLTDYAGIVRELENKRLRVRREIQQEIINSNE